MLEWLKRHAWKACIRQKRIPGSNPGLSAKQENGFKAFQEKAFVEFRSLRQKKKGTVWFPSFVSLFLVEL